MAGYARTGETVYDWLSWYDLDPDYLPHPEVSFVGAAPRLASEDAGASYIAIETPRDVGFEDFAPIAFFAPAAITAETRARVQVRSRGSEANLSVVWATIDGTFLYQYAHFPADEWTTVELQPLAEWAAEDFSVAVYEEIVAAAATEGFAVWVGVDYGLPHSGYDVSLIEVIGAQAHPLRWRQRNDGLGGSSPRAARGVTSQQGSNRHRGYL